MVNRSFFMSRGKIFLAAGIMGGLIFLLNRKLAVILVGKGSSLIHLAVSIAAGVLCYEGLTLYF
jgi:hypothetical protein